MIWVSALSWGHITHYNLTGSNRAWPHRTATNASSLTQALDSQALDYRLFATKLLKWMESTNFEDVGALFPLWIPKL
jgi:hypothetical protein